MTAAPTAAPTAAHGPALWQSGFRPFFLLAALCAAIEIPLWASLVPGVLLYPDHFGPARGHAHEMLWGYTVAVIAGFLLTAVRNWTGRPTASGWLLMALCALWLAGRILPWLGAWVPGPWIAGVDLAFLPALMAVLAVPLWQARNRRNYAVLALLGLLWLGNLGMHAEALGQAATGVAGWRLGLACILLLMVLIGGRVIPFFSQRAVPDYPDRRWPALQGLALATVAATAVTWVLPLGDTALGLAALGAAAATAGCWLYWLHPGVWRLPLLWVLYLGYAWLPLGLALLGSAALGLWTDSLGLAVHALTLGGIGSLTLGMMVRVSLGHTGRPLQPSPAVVLAFALISLAAVLRTLLPWLDTGRYLQWLQWSGLLWSLAFVLFLLAHAPLLWRPRIDGEPG